MGKTNIEEMKKLYLWRDAILQTLLYISVHSSDVVSRRMATQLYLDLGGED